MKAHHFLIPLLALVCCPPAMAENTPPAAAPAAAEASALPPALEKWASLLRSQVEPRVYETYGSPDELAEARGHVEDAIAAASGLYHAQMALMRGLIEGSPLGKEEETCEELLQACEQLIIESLWCDTRALAFDSSWIDYKLLPPPPQPGRAQLCHFPAFLNALVMNSDGSTYEIGIIAATLNKVWEGMQDNFLRFYRNSYDRQTEEEAFRNMRDPFSMGELEEGNPAHKAFMAAMLPLFDREMEAWKQYRDNMLWLVGPSSSYQGSGTGYFMSGMERNFLDTRTRFLCLLAAGLHGTNGLRGLHLHHGNSLEVLHGIHPYGEIFTDRAYLFRHPGLEGRPWCITFPHADTGFIPVQDGEALRLFAEVNPEGGEIEVCGYQAVESRGYPYTEAGEDEELKRPEGGMTVQQVFVLLECIGEEEEETEEAADGAGEE